MRVVSSYLTLNKKVTWRISPKMSNFSFQHEMKNNNISRDSCVPQTSSVTQWTQHWLIIHVQCYLHDCHVTREHATITETKHPHQPIVFSSGISDMCLESLIKSAVSGGDVHNTHLTFQLHWYGNQKCTDSIKCAGCVAAEHGAPAGFLKWHFLGISSCHILFASNEISWAPSLLAEHCLINCRVRVKKRENN